MADEKRSDDLRWLLEPPAPGKVHFHIAQGEGVELTPKAKEAIETLIRELSAAESRSEVEGYLLAAGCITVSCGGAYSRSPTCAVGYSSCQGGYSCVISQARRAF
jgi:hypothetical protein